MTKGEVTLEEMLEARESRAGYQSYLIDRYKCPIVSFTVLCPGKVKQNELTSRLFEEGKKAIEAALSNTDVKSSEARIKKTGSEAYYCVDLPLFSLKKLMLEIEETHPLGRLFDIDVIGADKKPVSRSAFGLSERKCLLCDKPAHACARNRTHPTEEIIAEMERLLSNV